MKERPILFSGEMVRAILEGRKTQTRRVVSSRLQVGRKMAGDQRLWAFDDKGEYVRCPYGDLFDRLWVRETWTKNPSGMIWYRADGHSIADGFWRPSIFMPRGLSRIALEVTGVRVERLQSITEADADAEGVSKLIVDGCVCVQLSGSPKPADYVGSGLSTEDALAEARSSRLHFAALWDSINGRRGFGWAVNPWVWVITFRRL